MLQPIFSSEKVIFEVGRGGLETDVPRKALLNYRERDGKKKEV